jgi:3-phenylpropionate/cinnamic acid dioxygenase small subunit
MDLLEVIAAEREISRALHRYARAADRHDWEAVLTCFHPDATDDHLDYKGDVPGLVEWLRDRHAPLISSVHQLGNVTIDVLAPDTAVSEAYCLTAQRGRTESGVRDLFVFSRYVDRFERRDGGPWLIAQRSVVISFSRVEEVQETFDDVSATPATWLTGAFGPEDPVYSQLGSRWHSSV